MSVTMSNNAIEPFLASDGATNGATVGAGLVPARKKFSNSKIRDDNMDIGRAQDPPLRLRGISNHAKGPVATVGTCFMHVRTKVKNGGAANGAARP